MSMEKWQAAIEEIPSIIEGEPSEKRALLLAALYILQPHFAVQGETVLPESEIAVQGKNEATGSDLREYMDDELADSEKYLKLWKETGNEDFRDISKDELRHFELLAKYARSIDSNIDLNPYMTHHNALLARLV